MSETNIKSIKFDGKLYYGSLIHSPDDDGYYVEIWQDRVPGEMQTEIHETAKAAWDEAKNLIILENRR